MDPFISTQQGTFYCNSEKLKSISGSKGSISGGVTLPMPFVDTISLTGSEYKGTFIVNSDYLPGLTHLNVSNTQFELEVNHPGLQTLLASNMNGGAVSVSNTSLKTVNFVNSKLNQLTLAPVTWLSEGETLDLSNVYAKKMEITFNGIKDYTLKINNNAQLTSITVVNASKVIINNCTSLTTVSISNSATEISITACPKLTNLEMKATDDFTSLSVSGCGALENIICSNYYYKDDNSSAS